MGPEFPLAIRVYLQNHQPIEDDQDIPEIFAENKDAEQDFVLWAENHPNIVENTPRLFRALEKAVDPSGKMEVEARNVNSLVLSYRNTSIFNDDVSMEVENKSNSVNQSVDLINKILADDKSNPEVNVERFPRNYAQTALDMLEAGSIKWDQLLALLSKSDLQGKAVVEYRGVLKAILPRVEALAFRDQYFNVSRRFRDESLDNLEGFFKMRNHRGDCPLLFNSDCFEIVAPLIYKHFESKTDKIESFLSQMNENWDIPLHDERIFKASLPLLRNLSTRQKGYIFSKQNSQYVTVLHNPVIQKMAIELLENMDVRIRNAILDKDTYRGHPAPAFRPIDLAGMMDEHCNTPLHDPKQFKELLPDLAELPPERLLKLLTKRNSDNKTPLDDEEILALSLPLLEKLPEKDLCWVFQKCELLIDKGVKENGGDSFETVLPLLEKLDEPVLAALLCIKYSGYDYDGQNFLFWSTILDIQLAFPILKKLTSEHLLKLFSSYNEEDYTALHNPEILFEWMPFLETLDADLLNKILNLTDESGNEHTVLSMVKGVDFNKLASLWDKLKNETVLNYFSRVEKDKSHDSYGLTLLHDPRVFEKLLPYLETRDEELLIQLLSLKNIKGFPPLNNSLVLEKALPLLSKLTDEGLNYLFSLQDRFGVTILHHSLRIISNHGLHHRIYPQVLAIRTNSGFNVLDIWRMNPSSSWLKVSKPSMAVNQSLTNEEYDEKAELLKQNVDALWETFVFGDQEWEVPKIFLEVGAARVNSPEEIDQASKNIKEALDGIIDTIIKKLAWLGTPPADQPEELHKFYCQMLINFEQVLADLNKVASPGEKASPLINIAKVRLVEGRCASGYQAEIDQARMFLLSFMGEDNTEWDVRFNKLICNVLKECIDLIVQKRARGDVHIYNELLFMAGLALQGDHLLNQQHRDWCRNQLIQVWNIRTIYTKFTPLIRRLDVEQLKSYFQATTPEGYGRDFLDKKEKLQEAEQSIARDIKGRLGQEGLEESLVDSCIELFQSTQGAALKIGFPSRRFVSETVYHQVMNASSIEELNEAEGLLRQENEIDLKRKDELQDKADQLKVELRRPLSAGEKSSAPWLEVQLAETLKEKESLTKKIMDLRSEFNTLKMLAGNRLKFMQLLEQKNIPSEKFEAILKYKSIFDEQMFALAEEMEVYYVPREVGVPSLAVEALRKTDYASQFFNDLVGPFQQNDTSGRYQVNDRGAAEILLSIGVMEMRDLI